MRPLYIDGCRYKEGYPRAIGSPRWNLGKRVGRITIRVLIEIVAHGHQGAALIAGAGGSVIRLTVRGDIELLTLE